MSISVSFYEPTFSSFGASVSVGIPILNEAMNPQKISWFVSLLQHDYDYVEGSRERVPAMKAIAFRTGRG